MVSRYNRMRPIGFFAGIWEQVPAFLIGGGRKFLSPQAFRSLI